MSMVLLTLIYQLNTLNKNLAAVTPHTIHLPYDVVILPVIILSESVECGTHDNCVFILGLQSCRT